MKTLVSKMKKSALAFIPALLASSVAMADMSGAVFTCPQDQDGVKLTVNLTMSPGSLGGFSYDLGIPGRGGWRLTWSYSASNAAVYLSAPAINITVLKLDLMDISFNQKRVSYKTANGSPVTVVCTKGPMFSHLFPKQ